MKSIREVLAENLKENRRKAGISQAKLAEMAEVSTQYIAMIETLRQFPTPDVIEKIAASFGIEAYELFSVAPSPESSMDKFHKDLIAEVRQVIMEALEKALADKHKPNKKRPPAGRP